MAAEQHDPPEDWEPQSDSTIPRSDPRAEEIFMAALACETGRRAQLLRERCAGDAALHANVQSLLDADAVAGGFLDPPVTPLCDAGPKDSHGDDLVGQHVGRYQIDGVIASGGMGTVYKATQDRPHRIVALKLIRQGLATRATRRRFEHEAEILGRLQHPNIAQVFDAGTFRRDGLSLPFLAMEYIPDAATIVDDADARRLSIQARVELIAIVCDAVHHAHQQGVIHRDLKPANIVVDAAGRPKVLDFGVARLTNSDVQAATLQTHTGQLVGTLPYMSPEQSAGASKDIDIRSDVYAIGVLACELLAGRLPYDLNDKSVFEALRVIREVEPVSMGTIRKALRGDLSTIVAKALEKDKHRRYTSASELAADLRRFLHDEAIVARPPSAVYQMRKFARRHRAVVFGGLVAIIALSVGLAMAVIQAVHASAARDEAEAVVVFLVETLGEANLNNAGPNVRVRELLDAASGRVGREFADQPLVEARLRGVIGVSYQSLGLYTKADVHLQQAFTIYRRELGKADRRTLDAMNELAPVAFWRKDFETAIPRAREALTLARREFGNEDSDTLNAMENLAALLVGAGETDDAEPLLFELLSTTRRLRGDEHSETLDRTNHVARLRRAQNRPAEAADLLRETLSTARRTLGDDHQKTLSYQLYLAEVLRESGESAEAEALYRRTLEFGTPLWGEAHLKTLRLTVGLATLLAEQGESAEAERRLARAVAQAERGMPADFWFTPILREHWAQLLMKAGRYEPAEAQLRLCLNALEDEMLRKRIPELHPRATQSLITLYDATNQPQKSEALRQSASLASDPGSP